jgi:phosphoglucomutase
VLLCDRPTPTPVIAHEILRRKAHGAINFTASHNPAEYHGLKFSGPDGGPALPDVTQDIEARAAALPAEEGRTHEHRALPAVEHIDPAPAYFQRLKELVNFKALAHSGHWFVCDALYGCGAGYTDRALTENGVTCGAIREQRDVLFGGHGPDPSEDNLAPLRQAVLEAKAVAGLATDGDADRFGILDSDGGFVQPNHILGLLFDYLVETRGWKLGTARSVATTHLLDAVARHHAVNLYETPVGFKYIGELIKQDKIALGGEESAGLSIRGHVPEKDGILACLLVAEMLATRGRSIREQLGALFEKVGAQFWPLRVNLYLSEEVKRRALERLQEDFFKFLGRKVQRMDRTDGVKVIFDNGWWVLMRLSGTEPLMRIYVETENAEVSRRLAESTQEWVMH